MHLAAEQREIQTCGGKGCKTCRNMIEKDALSINGKVVKLAKNVSCTSSDVIYIQLCEHCTSENAYVGQTAQNFFDMKYK